jgi:hypothetical protein
MRSAYNGIWCHACCTGTVTVLSIYDCTAAIVDLYYDYLVVFYYIYIRSVPIDQHYL